MTRIHDRDWTSERLASLIDERFCPIPPHRVLLADQPVGRRVRSLPLGAEEEYERAIAHGLSLGDGPADFVARQAFLSELDCIEPAPLADLRGAA